MKPGCFLKSIIILTVLVAVILYIIQHKSELFSEPGKKIVTGVLINDLDKQLSSVRNTPEKIELRESLKSYLDSLKIKDISEENELGKIFQMLKSATADSLISEEELKEISNNLKLIKDERPE
jgi:hypothetical protein